MKEKIRKDREEQQSNHRLVFCGNEKKYQGLAKNISLIF